MKKSARSKANLTPTSPKFRPTVAVIFAAIVALGGYLYLSHAFGATSQISLEGENSILQGGAAAVPDSSASGGHAVSFGGRSVFTPTIIPVSAPEIANPNRGLYVWNGDAGAPQTDAPKDVYRRIAWSKIETSQGTYDLSSLNADLAQAKRQGGKFSFRIMAMAPQAPLDAQGDHDALPQYIRNQIDASSVKGWVHTNTSAPFDRTYIPDWNNAFFLSRVDALYTKLGQVYGTDKAVDRLDIGIYGLTGEWHMSIEGDSYNEAADYPRPAPSNAQMISVASMKRIIDAHVHNFPAKQFVMLWGHSSVAAGVNYAMNYPNIAKPIGLRNDCMGWTNHAFTSMVQSTQWTSSPTMANRWKTAPFVVEPCNFDRRADANWTEALAEDLTYHVSAVGNGNQPVPSGTSGTAWSNTSPAEQLAWLQTGKVSGYRYELRQLATPTTVRRGTAASFAATWANVGNAPIYEDWNTNYELVNTTTGVVAWSGRSSVNLKAMLPNASSPVVKNDSFTLPQTVPAGSYQLRLKITDANSYYPEALKLAIQGRKDDGSYSLGNVAVQ